MPKIDRSSLLKFLDKPRFSHEVADHYGISKRVASCHLREAVKSGQVLISEKFFSQTLRDPTGKLGRLSGFLYIFRKSPMLVDGEGKFALRERINSISSSKKDTFSTSFLSKTCKAFAEDVTNRRSSFTSEETVLLGNIRDHLKTNQGVRKPKFDFSSRRTKLSLHKPAEQLLGRENHLIKNEVRFLSYAEKIHLFQALLKEPLSFLDIHGRFNVSKQTIGRLAKKGLLMELWGPKDVGLRYKLTRKGKIHLKELKAAAKYEPKLRKKDLIRLKSKSFP